MQRFKVLNTGIPELDELLGGGMPANAVVLLCYQTGTTFFQTIEKWGFVRQMKNAHIILLNFNTPALEHIDRTNVKEAFDGDHKIRGEELLSVIDCFTEESETTKKVDGATIYQVSYPFDIDKLYSTMKKVREKLSKDKWVIWVFDGLTDLSIGVSMEELLKFCRRMFRFHKSYNDMALYLLNMEAHNLKFLAIITQMADIVINFKLEEKEDRLKRYLQIIKGFFPVNTKKLYYEINGNRKAIFY